MACACVLCGWNGGEGNLGGREGRDEIRLEYPRDRGTVSYIGPLDSSWGWCWVSWSGCAGGVGSWRWMGERVI